MRAALTAVLLAFENCDLKFEPRDLNYLGSQASLAFILLISQKFPLTDLPAPCQNPCQDDPLTSRASLGSKNKLYSFASSLIFLLMIYSITYSMSSYHYNYSYYHYNYHSNHLKHHCNYSYRFGEQLITHNQLV